ncbi:macro domain-containing protein [Mycolicibacterium monacense]|uniref:type II toxin-antitoxin system antitoxin DNA ADP-ribosyl glycohydrolase DarG n=1 Tax=Mycolicibacterium monacense TaxID=85693 RepID=UPI001A972A43|nr:macro domain-containing protein [Mycolicibacterium monacense]
MELVIRIGEGSLLRADADALVNTVNTVGVMGKGIALQFKRAYPKMFKDYERAAKAGEVRLGRIHVWPTNQMTGPRFVLNFPTKGHWRAGSRLGDIETGLTDLVAVVRDLEIKSIAVPPLGCGNGGLSWADVEPRIRSAFSTLPDVDVILFPPVGAPSASSMVTNEERPRMTAPKAAFIMLLVEYSKQSLTNATLIESQKLAFFLQEAGEPLRLRYEKALYGPYADNLRHVLKVLEGHYVQGYGDGSSSVMTAEPLEVLPGATENARAVLDHHPETDLRIRRVLHLADGFETPYGLELLASVYWIAKKDSESPPDLGTVVERVRSWTPRKGRMFTESHIRSAWETLHDRGWVTDAAAV